MRLGHELRKVRERSSAAEGAYAANKRNLIARTSEVLLRTWDLGITAFGGPAAQLLILRRRFVDPGPKRIPWIDEQVYQELFSLCQATPGPASTKLLLCIVWIHAGAIPATIAFMFWSLPTAIGMLALGLGIQRVNSDLPNIAYAFLSGLNAAIVGIIAVAASQLSAKSIKRPLDRLLIIFGGCAGICYSSLWYYPILIAAGGVITLAWEYGLESLTGRLQSWILREGQKPVGENSPAIDLESHAAGQIDSRPEGDVAPPDKDIDAPTEPREKEEPAAVRQHSGDTSPRDVERTSPGNRGGDTKQQAQPPPPADRSVTSTQAPEEHVQSQTDTQTYAVPIWVGVTLLFTFMAFTIIIIVVPRVVAHAPRPLLFFSNVYLAGTIIFGGGPVLIPLLRTYVVDPGWVSPRDFLIGLAIIQTFPGPNFNFAVYLGTLALIGTGYSTIFGAFLGFLGIFIPGLIVAVGVMSLWTVLRDKKVVISLLRGFNCAAIGLIFTAVYRIWRIGYLSAGNTTGSSLETEPWWVVVATTSYAANAWFKVPIPLAIISGGVLGLCWFGVVSSEHT